MASLWNSLIIFTFYKEVPSQQVYFSKYKISESTHPIFITHGTFFLLLFVQALSDALNKKINKARNDDVGKQNVFRHLPLYQYLADEVYQLLSSVKCILRDPFYWSSRALLPMSLAFQPCTDWLFINEFKKYKKIVTQFPMKIWNKTFSDINIWFCRCSDFFLFYIQERRDVSVDMSKKEKYISLAMALDKSAVSQSNLFFKAWLVNYIQLKKTVEFPEGGGGTHLPDVWPLRVGFKDAL